MAKPKGQLPKAYLRVDPNLDSTHPRPGDFIRLLCAGSRQPMRGRFRDREVLDLAVGAEAAAYLLKREDVIPERGRLYIDGWDEWQEGDLTVGERMARVREKRKAAKKPASKGAARATGELRRDRNSSATVRLGGEALGSKAARHKTPPHAAAGNGNEGKKDGGDLSPLDHDTANGLEADLARLVEELAAATGSPAAEVLEAVSTAPNGRYLTHIRGASKKWLRQSIRDCARFRSENVDDEAGGKTSPAN